MRKLRRQIEQHERRKLRKRIRRRSLAEHFDVNIRTIDDWAKRGVIPPPHYLPGSVIPYWYEEETINRPPSGQSEKAARRVA
ncbi:MAG: hypothetical protein WAK04_08395 [Xanthobacteraceae bacterium]